MKTLAEEWSSYEARVLPKNAGDVQRIETRRAFYAGAGAFLACMQGNLEAGPEATDGDVENLDTLVKELETFAHQVKGGVA